MSLPEHIHHQKRGSRNYYTYQRGRNTPNAGPRTRIPFEPDTPDFWKMYNTLNAAPQTHRKGSLNALIAAYEQSVKFASLKPNTKRDYEFYLKLLGQRLGNFDAAAITAPVLQAVYDSLVEQTPVKAMKAVAVARALFAWGVPRGYARANPGRDIDMISHRANPSPPWPQWAFDAVARHARWEVQTFVALALYTGQRTSDVVNMQFSDIRGDRIRVLTEKTRLELWIPIHRDLAPVIARCRQRGDRPFIHSPGGQAMTPDTFRALYDRERLRNRKHGVNPFERFMEDKITPHGLRKSAVVKLREAGVSAEDIGLLVGMSLPMVNHYSQGWDKAQRTQQAMQKWEQHG